MLEIKRQGHISFVTPLDAVPILEKKSCQRSIIIGTEDVIDVRTDHHCRSATLERIVRRSIVRVASLDSQCDGAGFASPLPKVCTRRSLPEYSPSRNTFELNKKRDSVIAFMDIYEGDPVVA